MPNSTKRNNDVSKLHPAIRQKVIDIQAILEKEKIPLKVYEAFRTPELQFEYTKRHPPITWVGPWGSIHQYGLAVDFVAFENGNWHWETSQGREKWWLRMHDLARERGMRPLRDKNGNLKELAHVQLDGISSSDLKRGEYPEGGDHIWAEYLSDMIDNWSGSPPAPPKPKNLPQRPPIPEDQRDEIRTSNATEQLPGVLSAETDKRFRRLHAFIKEAEGGFANHADDPGGPTNLGITIETLKGWRGTDVTIDDVKALTQEEADEIFRTNYYMGCRCAEMPIQVAMVVYNSAVMSGPEKAVRFLQEAFNRMGMTIRDGANPAAEPVPLKVDGDMGPNTLAAANQTDSAALSSAYLDVYSDYLRGLSNFSTFGRGWTNRIGKLREFVTNLPHEEGKRPEKVMQVENKPFGLDLDLDLDIDRADLLKLVLAGATGGTSALGKVALTELLKKSAKGKIKDKLIDASGSAILDAIIENKLGDTTAVVTDNGKDAKKPLTPVNSALGETLGKALDGKKSVIGIVGLIAAAVVPELGLTAPGSPGLTELLDGDNQTIIFTLLTIFTGWGFLGKIDKAIRTVRGHF